ncbi:MAG: V-type ATPase subunit [Petrotogaceae bacterium]|nr:V-type ATPase subunit [Petrotogaceae bacterium]
MKYPFLMAKSRALISNLLSRKDYENMMQLSSVDDVFSYLKNKTHYGNTLSKTNFNSVHRKDLELLLKKTICLDLENLYFYIPEKAKEFLRCVIDRYELENIKIIFGWLHSKRFPLEKEVILFPVFHKNYELSALVKNESFDAVMNFLKKTPYYIVIKAVYENYLKTKKLFILTNALDIWYYTRLFKLIKNLGKYADFLKKVFFMQCEFLDISSIYRCRFLFGLSVNETKNFLLPIKEVSDIPDIHILLNMTNEKEFFDFLTEHDSSRYSIKTRNDLFAQNIDRADERILLAYAKKTLKNLNNGFDVFSAYIYLREYEYRDLVTVIESVRYGIEPQKAVRYLINGE